MVKFIIAKVIDVIVARRNNRLWCLMMDGFTEVKGDRWWVFTGLADIAHRRAYAC